MISQWPFVFSIIFIVRIQYILHIAYKICVNQLFILSVRPPVNNRLFVNKFWGSLKLYLDFRLCMELAPLAPHIVQWSVVCGVCMCIYIYIYIYMYIHTYIRIYICMYIRDNEIIVSLLLLNSGLFLFHYLLESLRSYLFEYILYALLWIKCFIQISGLFILALLFPAVRSFISLWWSLAIHSYL